MALDYTKDSTVLFEFKTPDGKAPTLEEFKAQFGFTDDEIDPNYHFLDAHRGTGSFLTVVTQAASDRVAAAGHPDYVMGWANTKVEPFDDKPAGFGPSCKAMPEKKRGGPGL